MSQLNGPKALTKEGKIFLPLERLPAKNAGAMLETPHRWELVPVLGKVVGLPTMGEGASRGVLGDFPRLLLTVSYERGHGMGTGVLAAGARWRMAPRLCFPSWLCRGTTKSLHHPFEGLWQELEVPCRGFAYGIALIPILLSGRENSSWPPRMEAMTGKCMSPVKWGRNGCNSAERI
ncbi:hypothetical protein TcBrA4_0022310 [Trypanosoma cruzi]|nr:hypothetical protein TcBrA4_0022310 [Trypanosoma cruzi]